MSPWGTKNDNVWPSASHLEPCDGSIFFSHMYSSWRHWQDQHSTMYAITVSSLAQDHDKHVCQLFMVIHSCACAVIALRDEPLNKHAGTQGNVEPIIIYLSEVALEKDQVSSARGKKNSTKKAPNNTIFKVLCSENWWPSSLFPMREWAYHGHWTIRDSDNGPRRTFFSQSIVHGESG